jgi:hypothetical protein
MMNASQPHSADRLFDADNLTGQRVLVQQDGTCGLHGVTLYDDSIAEMIAFRAALDLAIAAARRGAWLLFEIGRPS